MGSGTQEFAYLDTLASATVDFLVTSIALAFIVSVILEVTKDLWLRHLVNHFLVRRVAIEWNVEQLRRWQPSMVGLAYDELSAQVMAAVRQSIEDEYAKGKGKIEDEHLNSKGETEYEYTKSKGELEAAKLDKDLLHQELNALREKVAREKEEFARINDNFPPIDEDHSRQFARKLEHAELSINSLHSKLRTANTWLSAGIPLLLTLALAWWLINTTPLMEQIVLLVVATTASVMTPFMRETLRKVNRI